MDAIACSFCTKNKTGLRCYRCEESTCKRCSYFMDENVFEFPLLLPEPIKDRTFCPDCYNGHISDELDELNKVLNKAKLVNVFEKKQSSETRLFRRIEKPVKIEDCDDRMETIICLAFFAVQKGYDTIIDVDLVPKKVNVGGRHTKLIWDGTAVPAKGLVRTGK